MVSIMKTLIVYFSAEFGKTEKIAKEFAQSSGADLFEIVPEKPYSKNDLKWINPLARCNREHAVKKGVPVSGAVAGFEEYDTVFIGFPIWYGYASNVVSTFCKGYDWSGKKVFIFATSGGSGIGRTAEKLRPYIGGAEVMDARRVNSANELYDWLERKMGA